MVACLFGTLQAQDVAERRTVKLMGSRFDITMVASDSITANTYIDDAVAEIKRIENLISSWNPDSQTSLINKNAGIKPVVVDQELIDLVLRAIQISKITNGAFDISYASVDKVWRYDGTMTHKPTAEEISNSIAKIGYQNILVDKDAKTVYLKLEGMKIGFGAIGKGYAADKTRKLLIDKGVKSGIINASGDLTTWGKQPDGKDWMVGITNPLNKDHVFSWFPIIDAAVATSGNYEKFVEFDGVKYSHIIDPRTGYPSTGLTSVTIFAKSAELCDALATSVFITGVEVGLDMINQLKGVECIIVDAQNKIHFSENISFNQTK
ncbi:thiamine biosynthesis lipoprotein [Cellulophaga tyrosinoxydans]|uniref:FAD:protein FMN transferase n=2 Tax=Cellulophaga tyrosinoxydans TaxID=504486 RepID=A0A1W1YFB6_9FLAO|nr:FAD:protein FMN transferase [Cellulophaga tyrosinoxydans]SMC34847.1 thiamine biosynthesis lipoprotein [Cellulophaga tyrosinoxydans]